MEMNNDIINTGNVILSKVVLASKVEELGAVIETSEWIVRRQFRSTDKVFGKREAVVSKIGLPLGIDTLVAIRDLIMAHESVSEETASVIVGEMGESLKAIQNEIYKDAAADSESKTIRNSVKLADFNLEAIAAFIVETSGGAGTGERFKLTGDTIGTFFDGIIADVIMTMLIDKGIVEEARLVKAVSDYRGLFIALAGKKVLTAQILDSMARILSGIAGLDADSDEAKVLNAITGRIKTRQEALAKAAKEVELI